MTQLISEIKASVEKIGIDSARRIYRTELNNLQTQLDTLATRASKRDWNRSQQTRWVASERERLIPLADILANAIRRYLPE